MVTVVNYKENEFSNLGDEQGKTDNICSPTTGISKRKIGSVIFGPAPCPTKRKKLARPHSTVWGSYYDRQSHAWGYACCKTFERDNRLCPSVSDLSVSSIPLEASPPARFSLRRAFLRALDEGGAKEFTGFKCLEEFNNKNASFIIYNVKYIMFRWHKKLKGEIDKSTRKSFKRITSQMAKFLRILEADALGKKITKLITSIFVHVTRKNWDKANEKYLKMSIGEAAWPIGIGYNSGISMSRNHNGAIGGMVALSKLSGVQFKYNEFLHDESKRKFMIALKRLITFAQKL